jgi:hypothetical protein
VTASVKRLWLEVQRLRDENNRLRSALRQNSRHSQRIRRAQDNALLLATWHCGFLPTDRTACMARGMSQRQWENAVALLRLARIYDGRRWQAHDLAIIGPALERAADRAVATPEAFFARGNRHMRT